MIKTAAIINHPLAQQVGWAVLHSLWQGALIGVVFGLSVLALRRRSANARYVAGCLSLALLLIAPVATVLIEPWPAPTGAASGGTTQILAAPNAPALSIFSVGRPHASAAPELFSPQIAAFLGRLAPLLALVWVLGATLSALRLTEGCWRIRSIRTRSNELVDAAWIETLNDLRCRLGVSRPVRLLKSALVEVPTVIGWFRPVILLPAAALSGLTPEQLEAILAHELAHLRRLDYVVNTFQCLVEMLMFYHPVAWWISRCIREERENCCDDLVIQVCGNRLAYARALATLEGFRAEWPELAFAANGGSLLNRIRRLLGKSDERGAAPIRQISGLALAGIGLVLIVVGVRLLMAPATFQSTVRVHIDRDFSGTTGLADPRSSAAYDPYFIQTEFEAIQSQAVLSPVIEKLGLNEEWGKRYADGQRLKTPETMALLRSKIELRPLRNSSLVEIRVYSQKPDEAAAIANAIAESYRTLRSGQVAQAQRGGIKVLEDRLQEQEAKVTKAQQRVEALRTELNISDAAAREDTPPPLITTQTLRDLERTRIEGKSSLVLQETLLNRLKELKRDRGEEGLAEVITTASPDALLTSLLEQLALAEQKLVVLQKEYGPEHGEVVKCKASEDDLHAKINTRVSAIMEGYEAKVNALKRSLQSFEDEVGKAATNDIQFAARSQPYYEAKRNVADLERFRQILALKLASEHIEAQVPKSAVVEIVDTALPSLRPVSPNVPRALAVVVLGLLMDVAGLWLITGWPSARSVAKAE